MFPSPLLVYVPCLRLPRPPRRDGRGATYRIPVAAYGGKSVTFDAMEVKVPVERMYINLYISIDAMEVKVPVKNVKNVKSVKSGSALPGETKLDSARLS